MIFRFRYSNHLPVIPAHSGKKNAGLPLTCFPVIISRFSNGTVPRAEVLTRILQELPAVIRAPAGGQIIRRVWTKGSFLVFVFHPIDFHHPFTLRGIIRDLRVVQYREYRFRYVATLVGDSIYLGSIQPKDEIIFLPFN